jgi:hypothetical protein
MPYPQPINVGVQADSMDLVDPMFQYIADLLAETTAYKDATQDGAGLIMPFTDPYGEEHATAYYAPVFCECGLVEKTAMIRLGVFASKEAYDSGAQPFPVSATTALGGNVRICNEDGTNNMVPQNPEFPDFDTFIAKLDEVGGRATFYTYAKTQNPFIDNCEDC